MDSLQSEINSKFDELKSTEQSMKSIQESMGNNETNISSKVDENICHMDKLNDKLNHYIKGFENIDTIIHCSSKTPDYSTRDLRNMKNGPKIILDVSSSSRPVSSTYCPSVPPKFGTIV